MAGDLDLVTGAFGNTGRAITALLRADGRRVRTLTNHPAPTGPDGIDVRPFTFDDPDRLTDAFEGVRTFYDTYWIRPGDASGYETAVARSQRLVEAAARAGVKRIVALGVAHASLDSRYPYFRAKARVEVILGECGIPAAVVRPTLIFGGDAVLLHNLAWVLRRSPLFGVAGDGSYRVRPVHVDDVARLCVEAGRTGEPGAVDAVGPERPSYFELVTWVRDAIGGRARIVRMPAGAVSAASKLLGFVLRDDLVTREELASTMEGLADTDGASTGSISLRAWIAEHADDLGREYRNERKRRAPEGAGRHRTG